MKLIIDIPEKVVTAIQNGEDYRYDIHTSIAQGTPLQENIEMTEEKVAKFKDEMQKANRQLYVEPTFKPIAEVKIDKEQLQEIVDKAKEEVLASVERPQGEWIPITYRPMTVEERIEFAEHYGTEFCDTLEEKAFDCPMPEDGQEILISTSWGVTEDVADNDIDGEGFICYGLETNGDWDGVDAWMPKPEPYKKEGEEK